MQADAKRVWLRLVEREARCRMLETRLAQMQRSRSWRLTAPLRALVARLGSVGRNKRVPMPTRPALGKAAALVAPSMQAWQPLLGEAMRRRGLPVWVEDPVPVPRYLLDVTELALEDLGAGVQRVTRNWLSELLLAPPRGFAVEPVRLDDRGRYVLARDFLACFLGLQAGDLGHDLVLSPQGADVFVGLDFCRDRTAQLGPALTLLRDAGVHVSLVVPDVLPLQHPQWFPAGIAEAFEAWLRLLASHADRALCISHDCAYNLQLELSARQLGHEGLRIVTVVLGSDLPPATLLPSLPARVPGSIRLLMVGTLEPRKGYAQMLDAFDLLLAHQTSVELLIVGHAGWLTDEVIGRINHHSQYGLRLHWLSDADDATLAAAYRDADLLVMASQGEGYGLPIGEAGRLGCALLLRDLPVFHEVAGESADYFSGDTGQALAAALQGWIGGQAGSATGRATKHWPSWRESAVSMENETIVGPEGLVGADSTVSSSGNRS